MEDKDVVMKKKSHTGTMLSVWLFAVCAALWRVPRSIWYKYP